jgi:hypothetical protein
MERCHLDDLCAEGKIIIQFIQKIGWNDANWTHLAHPQRELVCNCESGSVPSASIK